MGKWSNEVEVVIGKPPLEIESVELRAKKKTGVVGENIGFDVKIKFNREADETDAQYNYVYADIYVNGNKIDTVYLAPVIEGSDETSGTFYIKFDKDGKYKVKVYCYFGQPPGM